LPAQEKALNEFYDPFDVDKMPPDIQKLLTTKDYVVILVIKKES
jgi:hypothetical protein